MKYRALKTTLSGLAVLLFISGCLTEPMLSDSSVHEVEFSIKNGMPCFAPRNDSTLPQSAVSIYTVSVMQNVDSNDDISSMWMARWQNPVKLAQRECIQYGADIVSGKPYVYPAENCTDSRLKPVHGSYKQLPSGECVGDDEAMKLENGITYFVSMEAKTGESPEKEDHYFRDFFCLSDNKNGETIIHRLKLNTHTNSIEACPRSKIVR